MAGARILLVDDEVDFTENMKRLLEHRGYQVTVVNSGHAAIQALRPQEFEAMVLDLKMPGMDGLATLKEVRRLQLDTHTLVLTGHGAIDSALEAMKLGAFDYLTKPCEIDELVEKLQEVVGTSSAGDASGASLLGTLARGIRRK